MAEAEVHSFTPVQRRQGSAFGSQQHNENANWTATRCQRLLRPIISRIEALKRDSAHLKIAHIRFTGITGAQEVTPIGSFSLEHSATATEDKDPEWVPERNRARVKRTYGRSRGSQEDLKPKKPRYRPVPGEILIPTPVLSRMKATPDLAKTFCASNIEGCPKAETWRHPPSRYATKDSEVHFQLREMMRKMRKTEHPTRFALYEGLYSALEALLKATTSKTLERRPSPRSLLSMCLRKVPSFIRLEEDWRASEPNSKAWRSALDQQDPSAEIYAELESLGTSENGWQNLKVVVRAHGIHLIKGAVLNRLMDVKFASVLAMLCAHMDCPEEAKLLLSCLLERQYPEPSSAQSRMSDDVRMLPFNTLATFVKHTENRGYQFHVLSKLLVNGLLPKSWLATKDFGAVWTSVFHSLSIVSPYQNDARTFLAMILPLLCRDRFHTDSLSSALDATLTSAVRTITSMCILHHAEPNSLDLERSVSLRDLLSGILIDCEQRSSTIDYKSVSLIAMSNLVTSSPNDLGVHEVLKILSPILQVILEGAKICGTTELEYQLSQFVSSIARSCGRCTTDKGFVYLKFMLDRLLALIAVNELDFSHLLPRIIVESALTFSRQFPDQRHLDYAVCLETKLQGPPNQARATPNRSNSDTKSSFRWEEGISEWVMATPAMSMKKTGAIKVTSSSDELCDAKIPDEIKMKQPQQVAVLIEKGRAVRKRRASCNRISDLAPASPDMYTDDHDESSPEVALNAGRAPSQSRFSCGGGRRPVAKLRRLGSELLQSQQQWKLFEDESDDELNLSFLSQPESTKVALAELSNSCCSNTQRETKDCSQKSLPRMFSFALPAGEESEDELSFLDD